MRKKSFLFLIFGALTMFSLDFVSAHCPLCTIGAGAAAGAAVFLGVSKVVVALFIGGFSMSMGLWMSRLIKKKYFKFQDFIVGIAVFLLTFLPLLPIFNTLGPLYLPFIGEYGRTYVFNYSLASGLLGGLLVFYSPFFSRKLTELRNGKLIPFQGILLTLVLLIVIGGLIQFWMGSFSVGDFSGSVTKVSPEGFEKIITAQDAFVLNVHRPYYGKIEGTDLIIEDWENVEEYIDKLPDNSVPVAVYCRSGGMSAEVSEKLAKRGYVVYDLEGGMNAWENSGRKIVE